MSKDSTIGELQRRVGEVNTANGWRSTDEATLDPKARVNAQITRLALITTEVAEAIEEIRAGHDPAETYYPTAPLGGNTVHETGRPAKPEGVPSELADIVIRALDAADAWGIDLERMVEEKLAYNSQRGFRHGGKRA